MTILATLCFILAQTPNVPDEIWKISPYNGLGYGFAIAAAMAVVWYIRGEKKEADAQLKNALEANRLLNEQISKIKEDHAAKVEELFMKLIQAEDVFRKESREVFEQNAKRHEQLVASSAESMQAIVESFEGIGEGIASIESEIKELRRSASS